MAKVRDPESLMSAVESALLEMGVGSTPTEVTEWIAKNKPGMNYNLKSLSGTMAHVRMRLSVDYHVALAELQKAMKKAGGGDRLLATVESVQKLIGLFGSIDRLRKGIDTIHMLTNGSK